MRLETIKQTFRAVWPLPPAPRPDALLTESLDRLDKVLDEREQKPINPVASMIDGMFE